jgi:hypothetical protein
MDRESIGCPIANFGQISPGAIGMSLAVSGCVLKATVLGIASFSMAVLGGTGL